MNAKKSREWNRLGRLVQRRELRQMMKNDSLSPWFKSEAVAGRLGDGTYAHAKDLSTKEKDYSVAALSKNVLCADGGLHVVLLQGSDVSLGPKAF